MRIHFKKLTWVKLKRTHTQWLHLLKTHILILPFALRQIFTHTLAKTSQLLPLSLCVSTTHLSLNLYYLSFSNSLPLSPKILATQTPPQIKPSNSDKEMSEHHFDTVSHKKGHIVSFPKLCIAGLLDSIALHWCWLFHMLKWYLKFHLLTVQCI